jgi:NifB/MoaA-like Fe-S oxidoreductase
VMLRQGEPLFLDDWRLEDVESRLSVPVHLLQGAADLVTVCLGKDNESP